MNETPTALIAEDEPLLAAALQAELALAWPQLRVLAVVGDGASAVEQALQLKPDVLFFDIRMPGMSGLEAAAALADEWDVQGSSAKPFPALVFATAYDQYAVQAFEAQAVDYLLKPVQAARLAKTVVKLQATLAQRIPAAPTDRQMEHTLAQLRGLLGVRTSTQLDSDSAPHSGTASAPLQVIQASVTSAAGSSIRMVPLADVVYFEAADKYVRVLTAKQEYLIRTPLKELLPQLDLHTFWQIHRGSVVRASEIDSVLRDESGKLSLSLRSRPEQLIVSRLYAHLFRAM
jgi:DNA-binding LytR/AlgR family response regulator